MQHRDLIWVLSASLLVLLLCIGLIGYQQYRQCRNSGIGDPGHQKCMAFVLSTTSPWELR